MSRIPSASEFRAMEESENQEQESPQAPLTPMDFGGDTETGPDLPDADSWGAEAPMGSASKLLGQSTLLIIVIAVVAAASLYIMRLSQGSIGSSAATQEAERKIELLLTKLSTGNLEDDSPLHRDQLENLLQDTNAVVEMFSADLTSQQVPVEFVKKNPFSLVIERKETGDSTTDLAAIRARERELKALNREFEGLKLQSVMDGARVPVAVINNEFYKPGDTVGSFEVYAISKKLQAVKLTAAGQEFMLSMVDN